MIQHTKKTTIHVDYSDVEQLILTHYGHEFSIPESEECNNYTSLQYLVTDKPLTEKGLDVFTRKELQTFESTGHGASLSTILDALCRAGELEPGNYVIRVSW